MTRLPDKSAPSKNNSSRSAFSGNNNNKLAFRRNDGDGKVDRFGVGRNGVEFAKKSRKLSKLGKSKSEKPSKSWNLANLRKKLSKSGNSTNFDIIEDRPKFFTPNARTDFNHL